MNLKKPRVRGTSAPGPGDTEEVLLLPHSAQTQAACSSHPRQGMSSSPAHIKQMSIFPSFLPPQPAQLQTLCCSQPGGTGLKARKTLKAHNIPPSTEICKFVCLQISLAVVLLPQCCKPEDAALLIMMGLSPMTSECAESLCKSQNAWLQGRGTCSWSPPPWRQGGCTTSPGRAQRGARQ